MVATGSFAVTVTATSTVRAALPPAKQHRLLPGSNLDLLLPPVDVGVFLVFTAPAADAAGVLKDALATALAEYYPLAGEMVLNAVGEPELLCSNRGVEFVEAAADVELSGVDLADAGESVEAVLLPAKNAGILSVQSTKFQCGGLAVGMMFDHRVADAYSFNMFLLAWARAACRSAAAGAVTAPRPCFNRALLSPRRPLHATDATVSSYFAPVSSLPPPPPPEEDVAPPLVNRLYRVAAADIKALQSAAGAGRTKMEAFTAHLWTLLARSATDRRSCCMGVVVDGRSRLHDAAMHSYFGNVLSIPYKSLPASDLLQMAAADVAGEVHRIISSAATGAHFRNLVDWVEAVRPEPATSRVYAAGAGAAACIVSSGRGFPVREVDFGWGSPAFGSYHFKCGGAAAYVMPMPCAKGSGDWLVYAHLPPAMAEVVEAAPTLFKKLDSCYELGIERKY